MPNAHRIPAKKAWAGTKTWLAWRKDDVCASDHLPLIRDLSNAPSVAPRLIPALTNARIAVPLPLPLREWRPLRASPPCRALREPRVPVYANFNAEPYTAESARELLVNQVKSPVRWQETVERLCGLGVDTFIECGPGKTLCGLIRKTVKGVTVLNVQDEETLKAAVEAVKAQG